MRIISKTHDYYDAVQKYGQDNTIIYLRDEREEKLMEWLFPSINFGWNGLYKHFFTIGAVGFCGKVYPMISPTSYGLNGVGCGKLVDTCFFNYEEFEAHLKTVLKKREFEKWSEKPTGIRKRYRSGSCPDNIKEFYKTPQDSKWTKYFETAPLFIAWADNNWKRRGKIIYDTPLKAVEFFRVVDTATAFQELSMFMANRAIPQKKMPVVPDALKVETHGFDKYSFRKDKAK